MTGRALEASAVRPVVTLLATSLLGRLPQAMSALALVRIIVDTGGGYALGGTVTGVYVLASTLGLPVVSRLSDRSARPAVVLGLAAAVSTVALVAVALTAAGPAPVPVVAAALAGAASPPLEPVLRSIWPRLASGPSLSRLFAADAAAQEVLFILGPLVTAAAIAIGGASGAVVTMAAGGLVGTGLFIAHALARRSTGAEADRGRHGSPLSVPAVRVLVLAQAAAGIPVGVLTLSATIVAATHRTAALSALGLAVNAAGALVGALLIGRFPLRTPPERALRLLLLALAVLYLPTAWLTAPIAFWLPAAFLSGISLPPLLTQVFAVTERAAPRAVLAEANAWAISAFSVGIAAGTAGAGLLAGSSGVGGTVAAVVAASAIALLGASAARPRVLR